MEIKNCEEYVLAELKDAKEELRILQKEYECLSIHFKSKMELATRLEQDIKSILSFVERETDGSFHLFLWNLTRDADYLRMKEIWEKYVGEEKTE